MKNLLAALRPHLTLPMAHYQAGGIEATYLRCTCGAKVRPPTEAAYLRHLAEAIRAAKVERARLARRGGGPMSERAAILILLCSLGLWGAAAWKARKARDPVGKAGSPAKEERTMKNLVSLLLVMMLLPTSAAA